MTDEQKLIFFQYLFAIAWVDGTLGADEHEILVGLFNVVELGDSARAEVAAWFDAPPAVPDWTDVDPGMREVLVEQVFRIAASDGVVNVDEIAMLDRLREKLAMDDAQFQSILVKVEKTLGG